MSTLAQDHEALDRLAKFPKGTPADPTKNMTPEQKAEWEAMKDKHGDKFKQANGDMLQYFAGNPDKLAEKLERDKNQGGVRAAGTQKTAYFTLYITPGLTYWQHPTKTLSRGAFKSKREADQWAAKNIPGEKYTVAEIDDPEVVEKAMIDVLRALVKAGELGVRVDRLPPVGVRELLKEKVVEAERGVLYRKNPAFDRFVKSLRGVKLATLDELALMAMDLTEGSLPHVALDRDLTALEHHARLAAIDVSAEQLRMAAPSFAGDGIRWRKNFFKMFFPEKRLRIVWWDLKDKEGTPHHISNQSVLEFINIAPSSEQRGIEKMLRRLDIANADVNGYLKHLAGALINNPQFAMKLASQWLDRMARHEGLREHMLRRLATDEGDMLLSRFEEGESADPTENMSEEDAKKWRLENLKNKDKFKTAAGDRLYAFVGRQDGDEEGGRPTFNWTLVGDAEVGQTKKLVDLLGKKVSGGRMDSHVIKTSEKPRKAYKGLTGMALIKKLKGKSQGGVGGNLTGRSAGSGYLLGIAPDGMPQVDSFVDPPLFAMVLAKIHKLRPTQVKADGRRVNVNGTKMSWQEALQAAYQTYSGESTAGDIALPAGRAVRVNVKVDSIYEQGMKAAGSNNGFEEGSRIPDGWDSGHIDGEEEEEKKDEGSDTPDGQGNMAKRAGGITMHALLHGSRLLGATDNWNDARTWSYWSYGDRKHIADELRDEAVVMDLYGVPLPVAEVLMDVGTRAGRLTPEAAFRQAKPFMKDKGHKVASIDRTARTGLYGFTKKVQADCESCVRKVQRSAHRLAKGAYGKNEKVAEFLSAHAKRADSLPAKILVAALSEMGPKVASVEPSPEEQKRTTRLAELRAGREARAKVAIDYDWWDKNGRSFKTKTTRAINLLRRDPKKALKAAEELYALMDKYGYPDNWHRVQRLKEDAEHEIQMSGSRWAAAPRGKALSKPAQRLLEELKVMKGDPLQVKGRKWDAANELGNAGLVEWALHGKGLLLKKTAAPRGKAQKAIAAHIEKWKKGDSENLTDISRGAPFRGVHFAQIMSAAEALKKSGLIEFDGVKVTKKAADKTAAGSIDEVFKKFPAKFRRKSRDGKHEVNWMGGSWTVLEDISKADLKKMWTALSWEIGKTATDKRAARTYGLYGFTDRVATLGLATCSEVRAEAGRIASDLHRRRTASHANITAFLDTHCKTAECKYSRLLHASYPDTTSKVAVTNLPRTVAAWLTWGV